MQVQEEIARRANMRTGTGKRRTYSGKYALSHHVFCAHCGDIYRRTQWFLKGEHVSVWRCVSRLEKKKSSAECHSRTIFEEDLQAAVVKAINQVITERDDFLPGMKVAIKKAIGQRNISEIEAIDRRLNDMQKELIRQANAKKNFDALAEEINVLQEEKQRLMVEDANCSGLQQRMDELEEFLDKQQREIVEYDEQLVRRLIEKITVYDDHLTFEFKSGLETEVQV